MLFAAAGAPAQSLFDLPPGVQTRWYSFENPEGRRGEGGQTQAGRKGAASKAIHPGERAVLADVAGPGVVRRIWLTVPGRVETLRGWVVRMYWDGQDWPSVEAPLAGLLRPALRPPAPRALPPREPHDAEAGLRGPAEDRGARPLPRGQRGHPHGRAPAAALVRRGRAEDLSRRSA